MDLNTARRLAGLPPKPELSAPPLMLESVATKTVVRAEFVPGSSDVAVVEAIKVPAIVSRALESRLMRTALNEGLTTEADLKQLLTSIWNDGYAARSRGE